MCGERGSGAKKVAASNAFQSPCNRAVELYQAIARWAPRFAEKVESFS